MKLKTRIRKLISEDKRYTINNNSYSLFDDAGWREKEVIRNIIIWSFVFLIVTFIGLFILMQVQDAQIRGRDPELVKLQNEREAVKEKAKQDKKQQYIDGCKDAGKAPTDLSDYDSNWSCK
jgi:predicted membrane protein